MLDSQKGILKTEKHFWLYNQMNGLTALLQTQVVVFNPKLNIPIAVRWEHRPKPWEQKINTPFSPNKSTQPTLGKGWFSVD